MKFANGPLAENGGIYKKQQLILMWIIPRARPVCGTTTCCGVESALLS